MPFLFLCLRHLLRHQGLHNDLSFWSEEKNFWRRLQKQNKIEKKTMVWRAIGKKEVADMRMVTLNWFYNNLWSQYWSWPLYFVIKVCSWVTSRDCLYQGFTRAPVQPDPEGVGWTIPDVHFWHGRMFRFCHWITRFITNLLIKLCWI